MKIIYNMDELAKRLGTGKITSIVVTDICLCVECSEMMSKKPLTKKTIKPIGKQAKSQKVKQPDKLKDFMDKMAGPRF